MRGTSGGTSVPSLCAMAGSMATRTGGPFALCCSATPMRFTSCLASFSTVGIPSVCLYRQGMRHTWSSLDGPHHHRSPSVALASCGHLFTRSPASAAWAAMRPSRRFYSSLAKLLEDPSDPYLAPIQEVDIVRIVEILQEAPPSSSSVRQPQPWTATPDGPRHEGPKLHRTAQRSVTSSGEAVLQSLHTEGLRRKEQADEAVQEAARSAQAFYDALPEAEKAALKAARHTAHLFDGLCALNAVLRMQAEDGEVSEAERNAAYAAYEYLVAAYQSGHIPPARWKDDFVAELTELAVVWHHLADGRPMPVLGRD